MAAEWILLPAAALSLAAIVWGAFLVRAQAARESGQVRRIRVDGAYVPSEVHLRAGEPARLIFHREETASCSERVVLPDFGISATLPPFQDVAIDLPASEPGEHEFTCQMRMLHGRLIVEAADASSPADRRGGGVMRRQPRSSYGLSWRGRPVGAPPRRP